MSFARRPLPFTRLALLCIGLLALALGACRTPIGVQQTGFEDVFGSLSRNVLDDGLPSQASLQVLALVGMDASYRTDPDKAIERVASLAFAEKRRGLFIVLSELYYARGLQTDERASFLEATQCAYLYLFSEELQPATSPYEPGFRLACEIYNRGLARTLLQDSGEMRLENQVIRTHGGSCEILFSRPGFPWDARVFSRFLPADEFQVRGLRERVRMHGLGVPLIAMRNAGMLPAPIEKHMGRGVKLPATALLRFEGNLESLASGDTRAALELYLSTDVETVSIAGHEVPLEGDITTALAYTLEESKIWGLSLSGFFSGRTREYQPGVYMLQPYQPGKIPIVLVHGTASTPATWVQLINGLMLDPKICNRYQFWLAMYNTGNPVLFSASEVRDSLTELLHTLDPDGKDPALARTVVVGHSQGGLIARLLVCSSGDRIWSGATQEPFDTYPLKEEDRDLLRRCLFFEPLPFIQRVVFIATPHRGSRIAGGLLAQLAQGLVSLPKELINIGNDRPPGKILPPELREGMPTSVQNMTPESRFIRKLATLPFAKGLHIHSIIAVKGSGPVETGGDGFVEYSSAHLDEAESEFVVRFGHSCQNEPASVLELRRILLQHLQGEQLPAAASALPW